MAGKFLPHSPNLNGHWIIDSGADDHMVDKHMVLSRSDSIADSTLGLVKLPNGHATRAAKLGTVRLTNTFTLHNALHVPAFDKSTICV